MIINGTIDPRICPHCGKGKMIEKEILLAQQNGRPPWRGFTIKWINL
jgi:hypothetical protein